MKLIHSQTKQELQQGDLVTTCRGDCATLIDARPPTHAGSTGRVWVRFEDGTQREFFPSVIHAKFISDEPILTHAKLREYRSAHPFATVEQAQAALQTKQN